MDEDTLYAITCEAYKSVDREEGDELKEAIAMLADKLDESREKCRLLESTLRGY